MGRIADVLTKSVIAFPALSNFWPQDWNASLSSAALDRQVPVTPDTALGVMAYWQGIRFWSQTIASLPLVIYERLDGGGKSADPTHPMYGLLHDQANPQMSAFIWRETAMGHVIGWGNHFSERQLDGRGRTVGLWPLRPDRMTVFRGAQTADGLPGPLVYRYLLPQGGGVVELPASRVLHIRGFGYDGQIGYSPIDIMRRTIALSLSAAEYGERTFDNDARPGVIYTHPKTLSDKARTNLEGSISRNHQGLSNAQRAAVLEEGITVSTIGFPPEQAQFLATRQFQVEEVARGLDLPPHVVGGLDRATFSNIDQQAVDLVVHHIRPMTVRWQTQLTMDLIPESTHFAEFNLDALLQGDPLIRAQKLWIERQAGVLNADEWRELENRNPLPFGDGQVFLQPLNMTTVGEPPVGAREDVVKPPRGVPNPAVPALTVVPDTAPLSVGKSMAQFDCPDCGKLLNKRAAAGTVGFCRSCKAEKTMGEAVEVKELQLVPDPIIQLTAAILKMGQPVVNVAPSEVYVNSPILNVQSDSAADALDELKEILTAPRYRDVIRDDAGRIVRITEGSDG